MKAAHVEQHVSVGRLRENVGVARAPQDVAVLVRVARVHRLGRVATVTRVVLPAALPNLFGGIKLALAYSFIGVIAGEFILSSGGLGFGNGTAVLTRAQARASIGERCDASFVHGPRCNLWARFGVVGVAQV